MSVKQDSNTKNVLQYLQENFDLEHFQVSDFPLMPGGKILKGKQGGELLIYWDILQQQIKWTQQEVM